MKPSRLAPSAPVLLAALLLGLSAALVQGDASVDLLAMARTLSNSSQTLSARIEGILKSTFPMPTAVTLAELPIKRPPPPTSAGYVMPGYEVMTNFATSVKVGNASGGGVMTVDVKFKPLPNVTSAQFVWLFQNLHKNATYYADNKTWPMYLIFNPVDHVAHAATAATGAAKIGAGARISWVEIPLTSCTYDPLSGVSPWRCASNRTGFVRSDPAAKWQALMQTKVAGSLAAKVRWLNASGIEFANEVELLPGVQRTIAVCRHTWSDSAAGLQLRAQQFLGLMTDATVALTYDTSPLAPVFNKFIKAAYVGMPTAANVPALLSGGGPNMTAVGYLNVLHYIQEYAGTAKWLPKMFAKAGGLPL